ncbi:MAG: prefoldin subunit beta [Thermoplasmata archaeon]
MVELNLSPYLQEKLKQAQNLQQQLESTLAQKYQYDVKIKELAKTIEELSKIKDDSKIYKNVGAILIEVKDRAILLKELQDEKETLEVRSRTMEKQQKLLEDKYKDIQAEFAKAYGQKSESS